MKIIHITTGDPDGVGLEVSLKALRELGPQKGARFILWRAKTAPQELFNIVRGRFKRTQIKSFKKDLKGGSNILWDLALPPKPASWVARAGLYCFKDPDWQALVTGPLSKTQMQKEGFKEKGHTDLLKKLAGGDRVFMTFLGDRFNVVLLTGHIPLKQVKLVPKDLQKCIAFCIEWKRSLLPALPAGLSLPVLKRKKLAILGLNPHAGEGGLLGKEEFLIRTLLETQRPKIKTLVEGPLVPDTAFLPQNLKYFMHICLYHDQGLLPFKTVHGRKSFQLSLGLPFIRSSVSHGTAKDLFGQNRADAVSMIKALRYALHISHKNTNQNKGSF